MLEPEQVATHPRKNVITRCIGGSQAISFKTGYLQPGEGDRFFLCTDGVYDEIDAHVLSEFISLPDLYSGMKQLEERILSGDARDNFSGILVSVGDG